MSSMTVRAWLVFPMLALAGAVGVSTPASTPRQEFVAPAAGAAVEVDVSDGGHAALVAVLKQLGRQVPTDLLDDAARGTARITIAEMAFRSAQAGLPAVILPVPAPCLRKALSLIPLPAIALVGARYVIIESRPEPEVAIVIDPRAGRVRMPFASLSREWKDAVLTFGVKDRNPVIPCD